jgi:hypothetical protein
MLPPLLPLLFLLLQLLLLLFFLFLLLLLLLLLLLQLLLLLPYSAVQGPTLLVLGGRENVRFLQSNQSAARACS